MSQFTLAFPVFEPMDETFSVAEDVKIEADTKTVKIPGCSLQFEVERLPQSRDELFEKFLDCSVFGLTPYEEDTIIGHESLILLHGNVKSLGEVCMVKVAIQKMLNAGAVGVDLRVGDGGMAWTEGWFRGASIEEIAELILG